MQALALFLAPTLAGIFGGATAVAAAQLIGMRFGYVGAVAGWLAASWIAAALALRLLIRDATTARRRAVTRGAVIGALIGALVVAVSGFYTIFLVGPILGCALIGIGAALADDVAAY
jgi:hypothetical protein